MAELNLDLQRSLHEALGRWATEHATRYREIEVLPYDPSAAEQQIATAKTPVSEELHTIPTAQLLPVLRRQYAAMMGKGSKEMAATVAGAIGADVRSLLVEGRSVAVLTSHAEQLDDIGSLCGALALALGDPRLILRSATLLNKAMSRETYRGVPIAELFRFFANVYWVIPESASASRYGVPSDAARYLNARAMKAILEDLRQGLLVTFAPTGTAVRHRRAGDGRINELILPRVGAGTANLLSRFDAYVLATVWKGRLRLGPLTPLTAPQRRRFDRDSQLALMDDVMRAMARMTEDMAGVSVSYAPADV